MAFKYLAKLVAKLELQSAQYQAELEKANKKLTRFERDSKNSFNSIDASAKKLAKGMKGIGAVLGVGGSVALGMKTFGLMSKVAGTALDNLSKSSETVARSVKELKAAQDKAFTPGNIGKVNELLREQKDIFDKHGKVFSNVAEAALVTWTKIKNEAIDTLGTVMKMAGIGRSDTDRDKDRLRQLETAAGRGGFVAGSPEARELEELRARVNRFDNYAATGGTKATGGRSATFSRDLGDTSARGSMSAAFDAQNKSMADAAKKAADAEKAALDQWSKDHLKFIAYQDKMAQSVWQVTDAVDIEATRFDQFGGDLEKSLADVTAGIENSVDKALNGIEQMSIYADQAARNMQDAFADFLFDPFDKGLKGMLKGFIDVTRRMIAEQAAAKLFGGGFGKFLTGAVGSLFGGGGGTPTSANFSGPRAAGGPVSGGKSYLVGERGPELFTPGTSGHITPNHALGGGVVQNITVDARGATVDAIRAIPAAMAEAKRQAVDEVADLIRRGRL